MAKSELKECVNRICAMYHHKVTTGLTECIQCGSDLRKPMDDLFNKLMGLDGDLLK